jgi:hypothetical protein
MKPSALRIERMLAKVEAALVPPPRKWLRVILHEGDDEAEAKEKALAEHVARHPEDDEGPSEDNPCHGGWDARQPSRGPHLQRLGHHARLP